MRYFILCGILSWAFGSGSLASAQARDSVSTSYWVPAVEIINSARRNHEDWLNSLTLEAKVTKLLDSAIAQVSKPYAYGAKGPDKFDCSGFTGYMFKLLGIQLPASSRLQANVGVPVEQTELRPGDLVFFKSRNKELDRIGHVGIVVSTEEGLKFIHSSSSRGVVIDSLSDSRYYSSRYVTARRVVD